jgi:tRNA threonylcarbamoyladenosine biosynthesis protein TsaB
MMDASAKLLVLETSGGIGQVGLAIGPALIARRSLDETRRHARDLVPAIAELWRTHGWRPHDLTAVIVSLGPGSYTGLRVGVMSAKALAFAVGIPIAGVPTFHALARQAIVDALRLDVIADARQHNLYVQRFSRSRLSDPFAPAQPLNIVPAAAWVQGLAQDMAVTGPGLRVAQRLLAESNRVAPADQWEPSIASVLAVGWERLVRGDRDAPVAVEPIYLRPSSAEEQWQRLGR